MPSTKRPACVHVPWPGKLEFESGVNWDGGGSGDGVLGGRVVVVDAGTLDDVEVAWWFEEAEDRGPKEALALRFEEVVQLVANKAKIAKVVVSLNGCRDCFTI